MTIDAAIQVYGTPARLEQVVAKLYSKAALGDMDAYDRIERAFRTPLPRQLRSASEQAEAAQSG